MYAVFYYSKDEMPNLFINENVLAAFKMVTYIAYEIIVLHWMTDTLSFKLHLQTNNAR